MTAADDRSARLAQLVRLLDESAARATATPASPADLHLASIRTERIQRLARELHARDGRELDEVDRMIARLLIDEYAHALGHLRAVAVQSAAAVDAVPASLKSARRHLQRLARKAAPAEGAA